MFTSCPFADKIKEYGVKQNTIKCDLKLKFRNLDQMEAFKLFLTGYLS